MPNPFNDTLIGSNPNRNSPTPIKKDFGKRPDGTKKGDGWLGVIDLGGGIVATEYTTQSDAVKVDGKRIDFPTLVPTLTPDEVKTMKDVILSKGEVPEAIMQKAIAHAKKQIDSGHSVFLQPKTIVDHVMSAIKLK